MVEVIREKYLDKGYVSLYDLSNSSISEENIYSTIGNIATLSYGNDVAKNPYELGKKIEQMNHLSVLEFIRAPVYNQKTGKCYYSTIADSFRHRKDLFPTPSDYPVRWHKSCISTFKLKIPIFVARQLMRHRCFSFLELSRRYVTQRKREIEFYIPEFIPSSNKDMIEDLYIQILQVYSNLLSVTKPEVARTVLPVSMYTELWIQGCRECFKNFFSLRMDKHAQYEIQLLSKKMYDLLLSYQPEFLEKM